MRRNRARFNQRIVIFGFFLIISCIIWYLSKLSHEYTTTISYPVKYVNLPKGKVLVGEPPQKLTLQVKAYGYTLLNYKMSAILVPIEIDVSNLKFRTLKNQPTKQYIPTTLIQSSFTTQISSELVLQDIYPDTLFLEFAKMVDRKVKVNPVHKLSFDKQYMLSGNLMVKPDSMIISGPKSIIDTVPFVNTLPIVYDKLNENKEVSIRLQQIPQVKFKTRRVTVTILVEKYTESSINVPIMINNSPIDYQITLIPQTVKVRFNVAFSHFFELKPQLFKIVGEYSTNQRENRIKIDLVDYPGFVSIIDYEPKYVEFILESK